MDHLGVTFKATISARHASACRSVQKAPGKKTFALVKTVSFDRHSFGRHIEGEVC